MADAKTPASVTPKGHAAWVRLCHWLIAGSVLTLAYSGIVILMAHPRLYWGNVGNDLTRPLLELPLGPNYRHGGWGPAIAFFTDASGPVTRARTFEIFNQNGWARSLHFLVAWCLVAAWTAYGLAGLLTGHVARTLLPKPGDLTPRRLWQDLTAHLKMPVPATDGGPPYGLLQKCAYVGVAFLALPLMILTGLSMSPAVGAAWPFLPALFGGSQSARTVHFTVLCLLVLFLIAHLVMVVMSGWRRQMRAMTFGSSNRGE